MTYKLAAQDETEITAKVEQEIMNKVSKIDKYLTDLPDDTFLLRIVLNKNQSNPHWTDALLDLALPQDKLMARGSASTPEHAVHLAVLKLERQLEDRKWRQKPYM